MKKQLQTGLTIQSSAKQSFKTIVNEIIKASSIEDRFTAAIDHQKHFENLIKGIEKSFINKNVTRAISFNRQEKLELLSEAVDSSLRIYEHLVARYHGIWAIKVNDHFLLIIDWWMSTYFRLYALLSLK